MTTLISSGNSEGTRRCDARCHEGTNPKCVCICGGRYHGKGFQAAQEALTDDVKKGMLGEDIKQALLEAERSLARVADAPDRFVDGKQLVRYSEAMAP